MTDTIKMPRPSFERRGRKGSGRIEHDGRGNALLVRSRQSDGPEMAIDTTLEIVDDRHPAVRAASPRAAKLTSGKSR
jgi:hypothetical protein